MNLKSVNKNSPQDFPLRIFIRDAATEKLQLVAKLPNSKWIPRTGETLILPIYNDSKQVIGSRSLKVEEVIHDLVDDGVYINCGKILIQTFNKTTTAASPVPEANLSNHISPEQYLEDYENLENELETLKASIFSNRPQKSTAIEPKISPKDSTDTELDALKKQLDEL